MQHILRTILLAHVVFNTLVFASPLEGNLVPVADNAREIYVEYKRAKNNSPTFIFLNGLTYETRFWKQTVVEILKTMPDAGILLFDFWGQGNTLLNAVAKNPFSLSKPIPAANQARDFIELVKHHEIKGPVVAVGLSYGGGIAALAEMLEPNLTSQTIMMAPYLEPATSQDPWIAEQIRWVRITNPLNPATDDELYDYFLKQLVYSSFPLQEPVVLENPYKLEGVFKLIQGIRKTNITKMAKKLTAKRKLHLIQPLNDEYIAQATFNRFWEVLPGGSKASRALFLETGHKVPEDQPAALASWLTLIASHPSRYQNGKTWRVDPSTMTACSSHF